METTPSLPISLKKKRFSPAKRILILSVVVVFALFTVRLVYNLVFFESTDDSFVKAHVHVVSSRIPGTVLQVLVDENQLVKKGQILVKLDPRDYETQIKIAQANFSKAHKDIGRFSQFMNELGPTDRPVFDQYQANALVSEAELTKAQLEYEYTNIVAAEDGKIGKRSVETGELIQPGQALMALVEAKPWIEANFKEHQVARLRVGQKVAIRVDAIPHHDFAGYIESISPGSGSTFSLLPPDNATGNFTKIVQRISVRVAFEEGALKGFEDRFVPGMSTEVTVKVQ